MKIACVAGEASGDLLGGPLLAALKGRFPDARIEGIGGPQMKAEGLSELYPMERLSVMGISEVFGRYRELRSMRRSLIKRWRREPPDVFIGIDAPDFNLGLERALRGAGIPTVHYVSPSVWAWRRYRLRKIRRAVSLMLTLFPFEKALYREHKIPVAFVGHPMADEIPAGSDRAVARAGLDLVPGRRVVALLPGSRDSELAAHAGLFVGTALALWKAMPDLQFVVPFVTRSGRVLFEREIERQGAWDLPLLRVAGHARQVMAASDVVLLASGTAALEAALLERPMVVTYRVSRFSAWLIRRFAHVKVFSLPNHLARKPFVPEFIQSQATVDNLAGAVRAALDASARDIARLERAYAGVRKRLGKDATTAAADAITRMLSR